MKRIGVLVNIFFVFHLVAFTWIFFRAPTFSGALDYMRGLTQFSSGKSLPFGFSELAAMSAAILVLVLAIDLPQYLSKDHTVLLRWPFFLRVAGIFLLLICLLVSRGTQDVAFLYFQF